MGTEKVIEMSNFYITDDNRSEVILSTYKKLKKYEGKKSIDLLINTNILTESDLLNINKAYSAATLFACVDMFTNEKRVAALSDIENFVGSYRFTKDMYRTFIYAYEALRSLNVNKVEIEVVEEEPQMRFA